MKIKKVKWKDHPILSDLELDFTDERGNPYQNILLAGENGTGKTSILKSLNSFLNGQSIGNIEFLEYVVSGVLYKATKFIPVDSVTGMPQHIPMPNFGSYSVHKPNGSNELISSSPSHLGVESSSTNPIDLRYYGSVFSKARADYKTDPISSITSQTLDTKKSDSDVEENFSPLKQLLVDIDSQDNEDYTSINKALGVTARTYDNYYPDSKVFRFKNAFNSFFDNITYEGVKTNGNGKIITFDKSGKEVAIDDLSTGEKQVVFRGVYLLRNSGRLNDGNVFIDEPELSMHPKWQRKILEYYTQLFTTAGTQTAQMFFATHSEHVLKQGLEDRAKNLVIALFPQAGSVITAKRIDAPNVLGSITYAETNYLAFNMPTVDYHIELFGYLQDRLPNNNVKHADTFIQSQTAFYNSALHAKQYVYGTTIYETLPAYIRNCIHHPDLIRNFNEDELRTSIELLVAIITALP